LKSPSFRHQDSPHPSADGFNQKSTIRNQQFPTVGSGPVSISTGAVLGC
jgi:hypothetical protein